MITLSSTELTLLQTSTQALLSPLSYDSVDAWRIAVTRSVGALLQADKAGFLLALPGHAPFVGEQLDMAGFRAYMEYYWRLDVGFQQRRKQLGLEVNNLEMVYDLDALARTEVYNDFSRRYRFLDALAMSSDLDTSCAAATVVVYHDRETTPVFGERGVALMDLLLPALKAGATTCARHHSRRASLVQFVDTLQDGCLVLDRAGALLHQTSALEATLDGDPEHGRVRSEAFRLGRRLVTTLPQPGPRQRLRQPPFAAIPRCIVRTGRTAYSISGSFLGGDATDPDLLVLVTVERSARRSMSDEMLRVRYALTPREVQVARLLETGASAADIASALGFTVHTAERHTERVMAKLNVHSRAAVGSMLRQSDT